MGGFGQRLVFGEWVGRQEAATTRCTRGAQLVHPLGHRCALVLQRNRMTVLVDRAERLVQLDVGTMRQPLDDAGLDAVLEYRAVASLQADAPPVGDVVDDRRQYH